MSEHLIRDGQSDSSKQTYSAPKLMNYGPLQELTRGALTGTQDFPLTGGTEPL